MHLCKDCLFTTVVWSLIKCTGIAYQASESDGTNSSRGIRGRSKGNQRSSSLCSLERLGRKGIVGLSLVVCSRSSRWQQLPKRTFGSGTSFPFVYAPPIPANSDFCVHDLALRWFWNVPFRTMPAMHSVWISLFYMKRHVAPKIYFAYR
jgi:hypothetical protein